MDGALLGRAGDRVPNPGGYCLGGAALGGLGGFGPTGGAGTGGRSAGLRRLNEAGGDLISAALFRGFSSRGLAGFGPTGGGTLPRPRLALAAFAAAALAALAASSKSLRLRGMTVSSVKLLPTQPLVPYLADER
jgi:hypothetical protein